jgi:hypothetical protein
MKKSILLFFISLPIFLINAGAEDFASQSSIKQAGLQLITAMVIKSQIDVDVGCSKKKYPEINLNEWVDVLIKKDNGTPDEKVKIIKAYNDALKTMTVSKAPNSDKTLAQATYLTIKDTVLKQNIRFADNGIYCDILYGFAVENFKKSKEEIQKTVKN